ncbi:MAG: adenosylcobalamin-dependent ribonucleoside-diphosphate reductase [Pseudomonadota bacterium]|jgi:ribonucleoside-diphosphate reductase, adenosylcobalamin-dependent|nr:MAG: adenosylcobalamin-dependent ribonucleoside-diphosphate reductase [Pseudomonadota bacterium]
MAPAVPSTEISQFVWATRYRDRDAAVPERDLTDTMRRAARAVASVERDPEAWEPRFFSELSSLRFLPGGRILAGAGVARRVTLFNCFVMGLIEDSLQGIFDALKEGAITMQQGGGIGYDFSTLRPRGSRARTSGAIASGPVSFLGVWDAMCATILSTGARRGAMMATLRCDHPDIEEFIDAKRAPDVLRHFNLSVLVTDAFMEAVKADAEWPLVFPESALQGAEPSGHGRVMRAWSGSPAPQPCRILKIVRARELWARLCEAAYDCAEPGVLFVDRINAANNLGYCESLSATNPCGEVPLPPHGACNLGSLNLTAFVLDPFEKTARFDEEAIRETVRIAVRFLDDVIELSHFPLPSQREQVRHSRRIGLGITGLADALAMLRLRYDSEVARAAAANVMRIVRDTAYETSIELARERGPFAAFERELYLERPFIRALPEPLRDAIRRHGIRNSHLTAIAPAGTISLLANGVSSGIEPMFGLETQRHVVDDEGRLHAFSTRDYAYAAWRARHPSEEKIPEYFVEAAAIAPREHLLMQAALQPYVDSAISKTITLGRTRARSEVGEIYAAAYELGLKGCTVYRAAARPGVVTECSGGERPACAETP